MIDASHSKVHPHAAGAIRMESGYESHKRRLNTKIHLTVDANGMPVRILVTEGSRADCKEAIEPIKDLSAEYLLADRGYDSDEIIEFAEDNGIITVIPPRKNRKEQRFYDINLYKLRHLIENAFLKLKGWRVIATRYCKCASSSSAVVHIRCIALWLLVLT